MLELLHIFFVQLHIGDDLTLAELRAYKIKLFFNLFEFFEHIFLRVQKLFLTAKAA